eukprot:GGOE01054870.1.p1 GENE.GGOE01054870.1~~GGOE01054870.1.p1  ORF type:complete len:174 (+),score=14.64 GGOE01054870.1:187-708(+)
MAKAPLWWSGWRPSDTATEVSGGATHRLSKLQGDEIGPAGGPPEAEWGPLQKPDVPPAPRLSKGEVGIASHGVGDALRSKRAPCDDVIQGVQQQQGPRNAVEEPSAAGICVVVEHITVPENRDDHRRIKLLHCTACVALRSMANPTAVPHDGRGTVLLSPLPLFVPSPPGGRV